MWRRWIPLLIALAALALYLRTMVPGVYVSDFAEFQYQPARLGLPHPNGFPLYMLLGWLISHLPVENVAWRMNLLSALGGALAVGVTAGFALRLSRRASVALLAGGLLLLLPVFWFYSLAAERYTLNLALLAGAMWAAWEAVSGGAQEMGTQRIRERPRLAWLSACLLALGLAMHPSDALLVPFWLFYLAWRLRDSRRRPRFWLGLTAFGLLPLLLYAYVPWRWAAFSAGPLAPGIGRSQAIYQGMTHVWFTQGVRWEPIWKYITGLGGYAAGLMSGGWREAFQLLPETAADWEANIPWLMLIPGAVGALWLARRDGALVIALAGFALLDSLMVAYIGQGKNQAYLLPAFWVVLFFTAFALDALQGAVAYGTAKRLDDGRRHSGTPIPPGQRVPGQGTRSAVTPALACGASVASGSVHSATQPEVSSEAISPSAEVETASLQDAARSSHTTLLAVTPRTGPADARVGLAERRADAVAAVVVGLILLALAVREYGARDLSREVETANWWQTILAHPIEQGAGLLGQWSDMTPLWYAQQIDGRRPDLFGLFPPDPEQVIAPWLAAGRPLYLAAPLREWAPDLSERYHLVPWGKLVRILPQASTVACPPQARIVDTPPAWPLTVTSWDIDQPMEVGQPATLRFCWEARTELPKDTFLTLELQPPPGGGSAPPVRIVEPLISTWYPATGVPAGTSGLAVIPVRLPLGTPPGSYTLTLVPYRLHEEGEVERWSGVEPVSLGEVAVQSGGGFRRSLLTREFAPLIAPRAGPLVLRAWSLSGESVRPGDPLQLDLLWEVAERPSAPLAVSADFRQGLSVLSTPPQPAVGSLPAGEWKPGMLLRNRLVLHAPRGSGDRRYLVEPRLWIGGKPATWLPFLSLPVGAVRVVDRPHVEVLPQGIASTDAAFGDVARLEGYDVEAGRGVPGGVLPVTLYWRAGAETGVPYWAFLHLVDGSGRIVAQHDSPPAGGTLPTDIWVTGEVVADRHEIALPPDLAPGSYTLRVGLYRPDSFERLPVTASIPTTDRALELTTVSVGP